MSAPEKLEPQVDCPDCRYDPNCLTCGGSGKIRDRRRPAPSPDPAELIRLAEAWVAACGDLHTVTSEHYADEAMHALTAAEAAFRTYVATLGEKMCHICKLPLGAPGSKYCSAIHGPVATLAGEKP